MLGEMPAKFGIFADQCEAHNLRMNRYRTSSRSIEGSLDYAKFDVRVCSWFSGVRTGRQCRDDAKGEHCAGCRQDTIAVFEHNRKVNELQLILEWQGNDCIDNQHNEHNANRG